MLCSISLYFISMIQILLLNLEQAGGQRVTTILLSSVTFYSDKITGVHSHAHLLLKCLKFKPWPSCLHIRLPCLMSRLLAPTMYSCNTTDLNQIGQNQFNTINSHYVTSIKHRLPCTQPVFKQCLYYYAWLAFPIQQGFICYSCLPVLILISPIVRIFMLNQRS